MKISFGAKILTKPEQFILPTDTVENKIHIHKTFEALEKFFDIPAVKNTTENDTLTLNRSKSKERLIYQILYDQQNQRAFNITMDCAQVKSFSANQIFEQITYNLAHLKGIDTGRLFQPDKFMYIAKKLYAKK